LRHEIYKTENLFRKLPFSRELHFSNKKDDFIFLKMVKLIKTKT
jgi:hypothetical protein